MRNLFSVLLLAVVCLHQASTVQSDCKNLSNLSGDVTGIFPGFKNKKDDHYECWNILNPYNALLELELKHLDFAHSVYCAWINVTITANTTGETLKFCFNNDLKTPIVSYTNVTVTLSVKNGFQPKINLKVFELHYKIDVNEDNIKGIKEARSRAINLLRSNWSTWKWMDHIPKAVTALALVEGPQFEDNSLKDSLMLKQRELQISISLLRDTALNDQLSIFINSLLSTCHNPRNFYGYNLVKLLKDQVESGNLTHPTSYLALCNANETWPERAYQDLANTYDRSIILPFRREYEAFTIMAILCEIRRKGEKLLPKIANHFYDYDINIRVFRKLQKPNGSFGNVHKTALITQALLIAGDKDSSDWSYLKAIEFLIKSVNTTPTDIISTYLTLPLLYGKTLAHISFTNCTSLIDHEDLVAEIHGNYLGPKIKVQYSIFGGEIEDVIYTISLKIPKNFTAFDVMQFIALKFPKYKFKYELEDDEIDIYEMVGIPNDPERRKFWIFYLKKAASSQFSYKFELGTNHPVLEEGDHIAMWYKAVNSIKFEI